MKAEVRLNVHQAAAAPPGGSPDSPTRAWPDGAVLVVLPPGTYVDANTMHQYFRGGANGEPAPMGAINSTRRWLLVRMLKQSTALAAMSPDEVVAKRWPEAGPVSLAETIERARRLYDSVKSLSLPKDVEAAVRWKLEGQPDKHYPGKMARVNWPDLAEQLDLAGDKAAELRRHLTGARFLREAERMIEAARVQIEDLSRNGFDTNWGREDRTRGAILIGDLEYGDIERLEAPRYAEEDPLIPRRKRGMRDVRVAYERAISGDTLEHWRNPDELVEVPREESPIPVMPLKEKIPEEVLALHPAMD